MATVPEVRLLGTEVHRLHSDAVGDEFEISVVLPPPGVEGPVPVVYMTDANFMIGVYANTVSQLVAGGEIPPVLGVAVGYPVGNDFGQVLRLRTRDFSPTVDGPMQDAEAGLVGLEKFKGGGAPAFLRFLDGELRPWVKGRYSVTDDSTLIGDSMGGLFATYTLLHEPRTFRRYVIGSPWLCWDHPVGFKYEQDYAAQNDDLAATVFLAAGADEGVLPPSMSPAMTAMFTAANTTAYTRQLGKALESRHYPNLRLSTRIFEEETHFTIPSILPAHGLRAVFAEERLHGERPVGPAATTQLTR